MHAGVKRHSFQVAHGGQEGGEMGIDGRGGSSCDGGRVGLGLLLLVLAPLAKIAISGLVDSPCHVVLAPIEGILSNLLACFALPRFGRFLLPCFIFLLFPLVRRVLLVLVLLRAIVLLSLSSNGAELGIKLELALQRVDFCGHRHDFLVIGRLGTPLPLRLEEVELALGHGHHGFVSKTGEITVEVLIVLGTDVLGKVVARHQEVGVEEDADGIVEGGPSREQL